MSDLCQIVIVNMDYVMDYVKDHTMDALALTETWLWKHTLPEYLPDGYSFAHVPCNNKRGGGICFLYKDNLKVEVKSCWGF